MQVIFEGHVTDISGRPNRVLRAEIPNPLTVALMLLVSDNPDVRRPQVLRPYECTELHAMFFIQPVVGNEGEPWQSPVIFIDQYGTRHKVENCVFKSMTARQPPEARPPARA
jgi:hypothetical protein